MSKWQCAICGIRSGDQMCAHEWVERPTEDDSEPRMVPVKDGVAAVGAGWAVFAVNEVEARFRYEDARKLHAEIAARPGRNAGPASIEPGRPADVEQKYISGDA